MRANGTVDPLAWIGRRGKFGLVAGLAGGLAFPALSRAFEPWIAETIALMLCVVAARIGARDTLSRLRRSRGALTAVLWLQLALPLAALGAALAVDALGEPLARAAILVLAAPSVTGAPSFAAMAGRDPAPGMSLLVLGTVAFPFTAFPILALLEGTGGLAGAGDGGVGTWAVARQSGTLLAAILAAAGLGFGIRAAWPSLASGEARARLDGVAAILLVVAVLGLMSEIGPLLREDPLKLAWWLAAAVALNFGMQLAARGALRGLPADDRVALSIAAGNRNVALYLVALPPETTVPLMVFVGCYQIPMYLTPLLVGRLER